MTDWRWKEEVNRKQRTNFKAENWKMLLGSTPGTHNNNMRDEGNGRWPNKNFELGKLRISRVFSTFHGGLIFLKMSKKRNNYELRFPLQIRRLKKMIYFFFWFFLTKILVTGWPKFTQFIASILPTNFIFWIFSNSDFFLFLFHIRNFDCIIQTKRGRVVGRAVGSKIDDPGSSPATANFLFSKIFKIFRICGRRRVFFLPNLLHLRKAKFFCQKYLCIFFLKSTTSITDRIDAMRRIYALRIFGKRTQITVRWGGTHESQVDCSPVHATVQRMKHRQRWSRQWPRHQGWSGRCQAKAVPHPDGICHSHPTHFALSKDRPVAACGRCWHQACSLSFY